MSGVGFTAIVEARGIHKTYDTGRVEVRALQDVDFRLERILPAEALRYE